jgi:hypothetical protein
MLSALEKTQISGKKSNEKTKKPNNVGKMKKGE